MKNLPQSASKGSIIVAVLALSACTTQAPPVGVAGPTSVQAAQQQFIDAQTHAQENAARAGDDGLGCAELEAEMKTLSSDPAYVAAMAAITSSSLDQSRIGSNVIAGSTAMTAAGIASSMIPGVGGIVGVAAGHMQRAQLEAQMAASQAAVNSTYSNTAAVMPHIYRMQRVSELASAKSCPFITGFPPG